MKRHLVFVVFFILTTGVSGQKIVENPRFSATTADHVKIKRIVLNDTITIIDFEVEYYPKYWINVSSTETYIQNSKGGEPLVVSRAKGITLDEKLWTPESGINRYTLYFPPLDNSIETIDFIEQKWKIFDIELVPQDQYSIIPLEIQGNWLKTDGSNEWVYGIYNDKIIFDGKLWNQVAVNGKGNKYQLSLQQNGEKEYIFIKKKKEKLLIGQSPNELGLYSESKTNSTGFIPRKDSDIQIPIFTIDTAVYAGIIKGYHPKMDQTGMAYIYNILSQKQDNKMISINTDGSFEVDIPMMYPQMIFIRMGGMSYSVFLEPGKRTFQYVDISEVSVLRNLESKPNRQKQKFLFMGDLAMVNSDLLSLDSINYYDYSWVRSQILDLTAEDYKKYCMEIYNREHQALIKFSENNSLSKKAKQIKQYQISYRNAANILSYDINRESSYRSMHKVPRDQREIPLEKVKVTPNYFDFISIDQLNNPRSLVCGGDYYILINRMKFANCVRPKPNHVYLALVDSISQMDLIVPPEVKKILDKLIANKAWGEINEILKEDTTNWNSFNRKHRDLILNIRKRAGDVEHEEKLRTYFGLDIGLAKDIMNAQTYCGMVKGTNKPLNHERKEKAVLAINDAFIKNYVLEYSQAKADEIALKLEANKLKTGYIVNETPKTESDKLFEAIIEKYQGKVVFVDFWATWCSPCRTGMEKMKPLKEELKDEEIEFVYITNQTSPTDTWNMMIPDIKGEHFRLTTDEWNYLSSKFNITGIPHYVLVGKKGEILQDHVYFASSVNELKNLFSEALKQ